MVNGEVSRTGVITVLAGPNGAGKSSVGGDALRGAGTDYFNPDEYARRLRNEIPGLTEEEANSRAWTKGRDYLVRAIEEDRPYVFETTLGGNTIPGLLREAASRGQMVRIWYVALSSADLHVQRVARRVVDGGHPIPESDVRRRYDSSRVNVAELLPLVDELRVFDNSVESTDGLPQPVLVLHVVKGAIVEILPLDQVPAWARSIVAAAFGASDSLP